MNPYVITTPQFIPDWSPLECETETSETTSTSASMASPTKMLDLHPNVVRQRLNDDVCSTYPITDNLGREQQANFVNEDGLYDVILDSRKPEAKQFRKWVTSEVLPSIRKTGGYIASKADDTPEE